MKVNPTFFSPEFRKTAFYQELPEMLERSPVLQQLFKDFEDLPDPFTTEIGPLPGLISIGRGGSTYCQGRAIFISEHYFDCATNEEIACTLAHEMQHARSTLKFVQTESLNTEMENNGKEEGMAVTAEWQVAQDLGYKIQGGIYDALRDSTDENRVQIAGDYYRKANPSGIPNLTYDEAAALYFAFRHTDFEVPSAMLECIKPHQFSAKETPDGGFEFTIPRGANVVVQNNTTQQFMVITHLNAKFDAQGNLVGEEEASGIPISRAEANKILGALMAEENKRMGLVPSSGTAKPYTPFSDEFKKSPLAAAIPDLAKRSPTFKKCLDDLTAMHGQIFIGEPGPKADRRDIYLDPDALKEMKNEEAACFLASEIDWGRRRIGVPEKHLHHNEIGLDHLAYALCTEFRITKELGLTLADPVAQELFDKNFPGKLTETVKAFVRSSPSEIAPNLSGLEAAHIQVALYDAGIILTPESWEALQPGQISITEHGDGSYDLKIAAGTGLQAEFVDENEGRSKRGRRKSSEPKDLEAFEASFDAEGNKTEKLELTTAAKGRSETCENEDVVTRWLQGKSPRFSSGSREERVYLEGISHALKDYLDDRPEIADAVEASSEELDQVSLLGSLSEEMGATECAVMEEQYGSALKQVLEGMREEIMVCTTNRQPEARVRTLFAVGKETETASEEESDSEGEGELSGSKV